MNMTARISYINQFKRREKGMQKIVGIDLGFGFCKVFSDNGRHIFPSIAGPCNEDVLRVSGVRNPAYEHETVFLDNKKEKRDPTGGEICTYIHSSETRQQYFDRVDGKRPMRVKKVVEKVVERKRSQSPKGKVEKKVATAWDEKEPIASVEQPKRERKSRWGAPVEQPKKSRWGAEGRPVKWTALFRPKTVVINLK